MRRKTWIWYAVWVALLVAVTFRLQAALQDSLYEYTYLSGWCLAAVIVGFGLTWWFPDVDYTRLSRRMHLHLSVSGLLAVLYVIHTEFRLPVGWMQTGLFALFVALIASTISGVSILLKRNPGPDPDTIRRWLYVHVPMTYGLLALGLFHGVFVHAHGALAHFFTED